MENIDSFNISKQIVNWLQRVKKESSLTAADVEELHNHLHDSIANLKETGLDDEEAFWVASKRMGKISDWGDEFRQENNNIIQVRRSAIILAGVLCYFFFYYFFGFTSKILFIALLKFGNSNAISLTWLVRYFIFAHFLFIFFITSILLFESKIIFFIENLRIKPWHTVLLLVITFVFGIINTNMMAISKNIIGDDLSLRSQFITSNIFFDYTFPLLFCIGFILLFCRYYKSAKVI